MLVNLLFNNHGHNIGRKLQMLFTNTCRGRRRGLRQTYAGLLLDYYQLTASQGNTILLITHMYCTQVHAFHTSQPWG
jgi:hypothetical protein